MAATTAFADWSSTMDTTHVVASVAGTTPDAAVAALAAVAEIVETTAVPVGDDRSLDIAVPVPLPTLQPPSQPATITIMISTCTQYYHVVPLVNNGHY